MRIGSPYVVVAGIDLGVMAYDVARAALEVARDRDPAELHLVYVLPPPLAMGPLVAVGSLEAVFASARERLEQLVRAIHAPSNVGVTANVLVGDAAHELVVVAKAYGADLLVGAAHGRQRPDDAFLLGSVAAKLVRDAPCAVLTVPPPMSRSALGFDVVTR